MNQISAFEFINSKLEQFQNTNIYYTKVNSIHKIFLLDTILSLDTIYIFKYDIERDRIVIYYTSNEYSDIKNIEIRKAGSLDNVFELFEWLVSKLVRPL